MVTYPQSNDAYRANRVRVLIKEENDDDECD